MHNWLGPYRVIEKLLQVHFNLRTIINKKVAFSCHANRMKPFVDPNLRPIDPPPFDPTEPYINESDIPKDYFEPISAEANPKITKTLTYIQLILRCHCPYRLKKRKN